MATIEGLYKLVLVDVRKSKVGSLQPDDFNIWINKAQRIVVDNKLASMDINTRHQDDLMPLRKKVVLTPESEQIYAALPTDYLRTDAISLTLTKDNVVYDNVNIGRRVELTYNVFVAPGVTIGDDAICAYGSYVNSDIQEGVLAAGLPAKVKRYKDQFVKNIDQIQKLEILNSIVSEFQDYFQLIERRHPLKVIICSSSNEIKIENNTTYIILNGSTPINLNFTYAAFNIEENKCYNFGINQTDFNALRKFLSRYGIRFLTC